MCEIFDLDWWGWTDKVGQVLVSGTQLTQSTGFDESLSLQHAKNNGAKPKGRNSIDIEDEKVSQILN